MAKGLSPTQRTLRSLREHGLIAGIVEKFNPYAGKFGIRQDLFGIIDIIALDPEKGVIGVQSAGSAFSEHIHKMTEEKAQECIDWLSTPGAHLVLWSWRKVKLNRGGKAERWSPRVAVFSLNENKELIWKEIKS